MTPMDRSAPKHWPSLRPPARGFRRLSALCLASAALFACGKDEVGGAPTAPAQSTYARFYDDVARAYCSARGACCASYGQIVDKSSDRCSGFVRSVYGFSTPSEALESIFDPEAAEACLEAIRAQGCGRAIAFAEDRCGKVLKLPGTDATQPGEPCDRSNDCVRPAGADLALCARGSGPVGAMCRVFALVATGQACDTNATGPAIQRACREGECVEGTCVAYPSVGKPCLSTCVEGAYCDIDGASSTSVCKVVGEPGDACTPGRSDECRSGLTCHDGGTCTGFASPGCALR